jgi:hypothetical protein
MAGMANHTIHRWAYWLIGGMFGAGVGMVIFMAVAIAFFTTSHDEETVVAGAIEIVHVVESHQMPAAWHLIPIGGGFAGVAVSEFLLQLRSRQ